MKSVLTFFLLIFSITAYSQIKVEEYYDDWGDFYSVLLNTETGDTIVPGKYSSFYGYNEEFKLFIVGAGDSLGVINEQGEEVIKPIYSRIDIDKGGLIRVQVGEYYHEEGEPDPKFGILSKDGKWLIEAKYDYLGSLSSGLIRANIGGYAYLDGDGTFSGEYDEITGGKWGFVNIKGKTIIPFELTYARDFDNDLANVYVGGHNDDWLYDGEWTYINKNGASFIPDEYAVSSENINGLFIISKTIIRVQSDEYDSWNEEYTTYGISNTKGEILVEPAYSNIKIVEGKYIYLVQQDSNYVESCDLLSLDLKVLGSGFREVDVVNMGNYDSIQTVQFIVKVDSLFGVMDTNGSYILNPVYSEIRQEGYFHYIIRKGGVVTNGYYSTDPKVYEGLAGMVDYLGNEVFAVKYDEISPGIEYDDSDGESFFTPIKNGKESFYTCRKSGKWGVINSKNSASVPFNYDMLIHTGTWNEGSPLYVAKYQEKWGLIGINNNVEIDLKFDMIKNSDYLRFDLENNFISVTFQGKQCVINTSGDFIYPPKFGRIEIENKYWLENRVKVFEIGMYGVSDTLGNLIVPIKYEDVSFENGGVIVTSQTVKTVHYPNHKIDKLDSFTEVLTWGGYQIDLGDYNYEKVYLVKRSGKWGLLNISTGKMVYECVFDEVLEDNFYCGVNRVLIHGKLGVLNTSGTLIVPVKFDEIVFGECGYYEDNESVKIIYVQLNGKWGAYNIDGSVKAEIKFDSQDKVPMD
jgi:hypothetical protein